MKRTKIYAIKDQFNRTHYIGRTNRTIRKRFKEHMADDANTRKTRFIRKARRKGLKLRPVLLESVPVSRGKAAERKWIRKGVRRGWSLKNTVGVHVPFGWKPSSSRRSLPLPIVFAAIMLGWLIVSLTMGVIITVAGWQP